MIGKASGIFFLCLLKHAVSVPMNDFFMLGTGTFSTLGDAEESDCVQGSIVSEYCGDLFDTICVARDGALQLFDGLFGTGPPMGVPHSAGALEDVGPPMVAPYWCDSSNGVVTYGAISMGDAGADVQLQKADDCVRKGFPLKAPAFQSASLFIATWTNVRPPGSGQTNTFQSVIATNAAEDETYVINQYLDNGINWGQCNGINAQAGVTSATGSLGPPSSNTPGIVNVEMGSNVGEPGKYVYCVHDQDKEEPVTCTRNGIQYEVNEEVVTNCAERCTCQASGMFTCVPQRCPPINGPTCTASGDPHYVSWDGRRFDFQRDCEHVMAQSCGSNDFVISANNDNCGRGVSCVRGVRISIPGSNPSEIYIDQGSRLFFNGVQQASNDQTYPSDVDVNIRRTGGRVHVTLRQHGVYVHYDGGSYLKIQVSTDYRGTNRLCGLCGNYNGNRNDDRTTIGDLRCPGGRGRRSAQGEGTDQCDNSAGTQAAARAECRVMNTSGIFTVCNTAVVPGPFIKDCEFDYCCGDTSLREEYVCDAYSSYAAACAEAGTQPSNWRSEFCPASCPDGMIFQQCGSFCPKTCEEMDSDELCEGRCAEGCFCPPGQYLLDGRCVDAEICTACELNGVTVLDGQQIQPNCTSKCTCQHGTFVCEAQTCLLDGPTCVIAGDPHYQTYDLRYFDFQGDCEYTVSKPCSSNEFDISVRNEAHNDRVSCADQVTVKGGGLTIVLGRGNGGTITIDGALQANKGDGVITENSVVQVLRTGGHPNVLFPTHGVRVFFDGLYRVEVTVSKKWQGKLCGLCGNYNGDDDDDNQNPGGMALTDPNDFGNSWIVGNSAGCNAPDTDIRRICPSALRVGVGQSCSVFTGDFFSACNALVDSAPYRSNCIFDTCGCNAENRKECYCESLAAYAAVCAARGVALPDWRAKYRCPVTCPANMVYQQCGSIYPQSCDSVGRPRIGGCAQGCFCPAGLVVDDNGRCVEPTTCPDLCSPLTAPGNGMVNCSSEGTCVFTCNTGYTLSGSAVRRCQEDGTYTGTQPTCTQGCTHNGGTVEEGQQIQPDCSMRCTCRGGNLQCVPQECPIDGPTCYAVGDPHYRTFDSRFYDFQGGCSYVLAQPCDGDDFSVIARNLAHNERVSCVDQVTISVPGENNFTVVLGRGLGGTVTINGDLQTHAGDGEIYATRDVQVLRIGNNLHVILPTIGVRIFWDGRWRVEVTVSKQWANRVCGMCGDYNGNAADDFQDPDGNALATPNEFGESWETDDTRLFCTPTVDAMCSPEDGVQARERCAGMRSAVFSACNRVVDPTTYINDCVVDGCNCEEEDREACFCESFAAYASACTSAGVPVPGWRNLLDCPSPCTGGQTFQQCGPLCPQTCENIGATCTGGCAEGCFCPLGQVVNRDGNCEDASTCEPICPRIFAPVDGMISCQLGANNVANPGETCTFTCDDGFTLTGSSSRTCQNDRTWSGTEPMCGTGPTCPPLTAPGNGDIDCSLGDDGEANPGDTCTFTCDDGYELGGSTSRTCGDDGSWSGTDTTCTRIPTCPPLTAPGNGDIDCSLGDDGEANPGDTCTFTCDDGYELGGSTSRTCGDDGSWSGTDTTCAIGCENSGIDLVFVLDGSGSITATRFQFIREFAESVSNTLTIGLQDSLVGVIVFSGSASIEFNLQQHTSKATLLPAINPGIPYPTGGTNTAAALQLLLSSAQDGTMGVRNGRTQIAIVVTDGRSNNRRRTIAAADALHAAGIYQVYAAGLGGANIDELNAIASDPSLVFFKDSFDMDTVMQLTENFTQTICKEETCQPLTAPENGDIDCSLGNDGQPSLGDTCTFTCDDGYKLSGSTNRTCQIDGSWSGTDTVCIRATTTSTSAAEPSPTTSTIDMTATLTVMAMTTRAISTSTITISPSPTSVITCPPLVDAPRNGDIDCSLGDDGKANPGDTCTYTCDDGYGLQEGSTTRTCQNDGTWSGMEPRCRRVCDPLTAPDNGMIDCSLGGDGAANPRDTCTFTCDDGFRLRGNAVRVCEFKRGEGTSWSGNEASCEPVPVCPTLMAPENGMIDCSLGDDGIPTNGDTCTFSCDNGFTLRGSAMRECRINRRGMDWNGDEARCVAGRVCPTLMAPENGMIDCSLGDDGAATNGDTCTVTCNDGFTLRGDATRTCRINRRGMRWQGDEARCVSGRVCPTLMAPENGMIDCSLGDDGAATNGDTCTVKCNDGFMLNGDATRTCRITRRVRRWQGDEARCVSGRVCPTLMSPDNGMIDCSLGDDGAATNGDTCTVTCNDGFTLRGDATRTCQITRRIRWLGDEARCVQVTGPSCNPLSAPDNGKIDCSLGGDGVPTNGDRCRFTCNDGFELSGSQSRRCRIRNNRGRWSGDPATCNMVTTCPVLSAPENGTISCSPGNDSPGDTCTFTCDDGFEISGTQSRTCQDDGTWNGADDTLCLGCIDIGSITVRTITRDDRATVTFSSHQDATFTCQLDNGAAVTCTSPQVYTGLSVGSHSITLVSTCPGETKGISNKSTFRIRG